MRTLRSAADLLHASGDLPGLAALARGVGFGEPTPLGELATSLGIGDAVADAAVARGPGALRALLCTVSGAGRAREAVSRIALRLSARSPELLWLVCVAEPGSGATVVATWSPERRSPRVSALAVERSRVVDSDAETLCALAAAAEPDDVLTHARWLDVLGREALTRRFYRALERVVGELASSAGGPAPEAVRRELALLDVSRLLFLSFLEAKGWLDGDRAFLQRGFERCMADGGRYHARVLRPLFFGTLNTPVRKRAAVARRFGRVPFLNGGLFACAGAERRWRALEFPDEALGRVYGELLGRYRFTAREDAAEWTEAAVDPEMLGKAFESLMASAERRSSGAFYTPQPLVERVVSAALVRALSGGVVRERDVGAVLGGERPRDAVALELGRRAAALRVLDPACGSGAMLVHALERLAAVRIACGDGRAADVVRRDVLTGSVFGVDVNPTAVWLCELRLWLSAVIDSGESDALRVAPLPNLDRNVRVGDSLAGAAFGGAPGAVGRRVAELRGRYARAVGARKRTLARCLEREERAAAVAALDRGLVAAVAERAELSRRLRARDLFGGRATPTAADRGAVTEVRERVRRLRGERRRLVGGGALPFSYGTHFADVARAGGFGAIVANPPWVRLHRLAPAERARLRQAYRVYRGAAWDEGAAAARAGRGFGGQVDVAALFVERSLALVRPGGVCALLVPSKLWRSLAGGGVRRLLAEAATVWAVEDYAEGASGFDAAVYPSLLVAGRRDGDGELDGLVAEGREAREGACCRVLVRRAAGDIAWEEPAGALAVDGSAAGAWLLAPPEVRRGFDLLRAAGDSLGSGVLGRPWLGVKSGCNEAFVARVVGGDAVAAELRGRDGRRGCVRWAFVRPLLRGEGVRRWRAECGDEVIVWPHDGAGAAVKSLPADVARWLGPSRGRLERRSDAARGAWWSLFRVDGSVGGAARVVWSDIGRRPRAAVLAGGSRVVALNSCYVLPCGEEEDAYAFAALLNSSLVGAWLNVLAEPARGGYRRYLGWTVSLLPVPRRWASAGGELAALGRRASGGAEAGRVDDGTEEAIDEAVRAAYGVTAASVRALLDWGMA